MNHIALAMSSLLLVITFYIPTTAAAAGAGQEGLVSGNGRVTLKRQPELLRVTFSISADGKDVAEAISKLKELQTVTTKKLTELGAAEKAVEVGPIQIGSGSAANDPQRQYMERMARSRGRGPKPANLPVSVSVSSPIKAEWPLAAGTPEELLVSSYNLQNKIKAAAMAKKDTKKLTPEEQEAFEEAQAMQGGVNPDEPAFQFVTRISDEAHAAAMAEAFQKARADAARLAKAAGAELGALHNLTSASNSPGANTENEDQVYMRMFMRQMTGVAPSAASDSGVNEAVALVPGPVELHVVVTASFELK